MTVMSDTSSKMSDKNETFPANINELQIQMKTDFQMNTTSSILINKTVSFLYFISFFTFSANNKMMKFIFPIHSFIQEK